MQILILYNQGDVFYGGANALDQTANGLSPSSAPLRSNQLQRPQFQQQFQQQQFQQSQQVRHAPFSHKV
jgi:hypothetical protein